MPEEVYKRPVCTVVSLMPFALREDKVGLSPGEFAIEPGSPDDPQFIHITKGQIRMMDQDFNPFLMDVPVEQIAKSLVNDYVSAQIIFDPDVKPGLFWVQGRYESKEALLKDHTKKFAEAVANQRRWMMALVQLADDDWARWKQHRHIGDLQRIAGRYLNMEREWLMDEADMTKKCPACQTIVSTVAAVCFACKAILDAEKHKKLQFATG